MSLRLPFSLPLLIATNIVSGRIKISIYQNVTEMQFCVLSNVVVPPSLCQSTSQMTLINIAVNKVNGTTHSITTNWTGFRVRFLCPYKTGCA